MDEIAKGFTEDETKQIHWMLQATWQAIGSEYLELGGGKSIPKSQVIEAVLDADYLEMYGPRKGPKSDVPAQKALLERFRKLDYKEQIKVAKQTFKFSRYGM